MGILDIFLYKCNGQDILKGFNVTLHNIGNFKPSSNMIFIEKCLFLALKITGFDKDNY